MSLLPSLFRSPRIILLFGYLFATSTSEIFREQASTTHGLSNTFIKKRVQHWRIVSLVCLLLSDFVIDRLWPDSAIP